MSDLFDSGINKVQGSIQQGKQKLQMVTEISQLKNFVNENLEKRAIAIFKMGEEVYKKIRKGEIQDEKLHSLTGQIMGLDQEVYRAQTRLTKLNEQIQTEVRCKNCGNVVAPGDRFCGSCGTTVEEIKRTDDIETKVCRSCEEMVPAQAVFCSCCGNNLAE